MTLVRQFGRLGDGRSVEAVTLGSPVGLEAEVLTYGAILRRLTFPVRGQRRNLILSLDDLAQYEQDPAYVGPVVGRFANRIANGRFAIDGEFHQLTRNETATTARRRARYASALASAKSPTRPPALAFIRGRRRGYPGNLDITLDL